MCVYLCVPHCGADVCFCMYVHAHFVVSTCRTVWTQRDGVIIDTDVLLEVTYVV